LCSTHFDRTCADRAARTRQNTAELLLLLRLRRRPLRLLWLRLSRPSLSLSLCQRPCRSRSLHSLLRRPRLLLRHLHLLLQPRPPLRLLRLLPLLSFLRRLSSLRLHWRPHLWRLLPPAPSAAHAGPVNTCGKFIAHAFKKDSCRDYSPSCSGCSFPFGDRDPIGRRPLSRSDSPLCPAGALLESPFDPLRLLSSCPKSSSAHPFHTMRAHCSEFSFTQISTQFAFEVGEKCDAAARYNSAAEPSISGPRDTTMTARSKERE